MAGKLYLHMNKDIFDLSGKVVILTGGLGLLGMNYAGVLISKNARVVILDLAKKKEAERILKSKFSNQELNKCFYYQADISDQRILMRIKKEILNKFGKIDVLINNAALIANVEKGILSQSKNKIENLDLDAWNREMKVNLTGTLLCCKVFGAVMKRGASIINVSSIYGVVGPYPGIYPKGFVKPVAYSASKGSIVALTKYLAAYWGKKGIRVNCLVPGGISNNGRENKNFVKKYSALSPLGRLGKPDEINGVILLLASNASSYMTGSLVTVDGGWTAQ